ncbi:MAG: hypothetical protein Q7R34_01495 [Dehalococcoidia bacterium]|nr:hypothetical protein [Dehalococcoidia bacterium]
MAKRKESITKQIEALKNILNEENKAASIKKLEKALACLDIEEIDKVEGLEDVEQAIQDYRDIEKEGMSPEEYQEEKTTAFEVINDSLDALEIIEEDEEEPETEPAPEPVLNPTAPVVPEESAQTGDTILIPNLGHLLVLDITGKIMKVKDEKGNVFNYFRSSIPTPKSAPALKPKLEIKQVPVTLSPEIKSDPKPQAIPALQETLRLLLELVEEEHLILRKNRNGDILGVQRPDSKGDVIEQYLFDRDDKGIITGIARVDAQGNPIEEKLKPKPKPAQVVVKKEPAKKVTKPKPQPAEIVPPLLPPPERYGSLQPGRERPFGACQFIIEFLKGHTSISGKEGEIAIDKPIDPARGAPQVEIVRNYKLALHKYSVRERIMMEEEKRIKKGMLAFTAEEAEERARVLMNRPMNRCRMRYHSFLIYFGMLKRLGWVEVTMVLSPEDQKIALTEPSMLQLRNLPEASSRVYYRITPRGMAATEDQVRNPLMALYPKFNLEYFKRKKEERKERMKI